jgi:hypothetical protein
MFSSHFNRISLGKFSVFGSESENGKVLFTHKREFYLKLNNHIEFPFGKQNLSDFEIFKDFTKFKETQPE